MKKILGLLAVLVVFIVVAVVAMLLVPPTSWAKHLVIKSVRDAAGLDLKIGGPMTLRMLPNVDLRAEGVTISNPAHPPEKPMATAKAIEIKSPLWPMLWGDFRIQTVVLAEPVIDVEIDKNGRPSWVAAPATRSVTQAPKGQVSIVSIEATGARISYRDQTNGRVARIEGARITARDVSQGAIAEAIVEAAQAALTDPANGADVEVTELSAKATGVDPLNAKDVTASGGTVKLRRPGQTFVVEGDKITAKVDGLGLAGAGAVALSGAGFRLRDTPTAAPGFSTGAFTASAQSLKGGRLEQVALKGAHVTFGSPARSTAPAGAPTMLDEVEAKMPVLALGAPIDADVAVTWKKERLAGKVKVPTPEALVGGPSIPANLSLKGSRADIDFDGIIDTTTGIAKGSTRATTASLAGVGTWLGVSLPSSAAGAASIAGALEAGPNRMVLSNGRIEHAGNALTGALTVDLTGARPSIAGKLSGDKIALDRYVGAAPPKRSGPVTVRPQVAVNDVLKAQLKAILDQPVTRSGGADTIDVPLEALTAKRAAPKTVADGFQWSSEKVDLSALRSVDLDLDVSIKTLNVRGFDIAVPQLKTLLKDGALSLDGRDLATRGGRLTAKADVDVRQPAPKIAATFKADGIDVLEVSEALGITGLIAGTTSLEGNLSGVGASQKDLAQTLTGTLKTRMGAGQVVGYDFSSVLSWVFGSREYDPEKRTPITRLTADLNFDNGIAKESQVEVDGPVLGANAEGSMRLIDQEIDYRARLRLSSWFRAISLRIFGDWSEPNIAPDLGSVFSRSAPGGAAEAQLTEALAGALSGVDVKDPELAVLVTRVLERSGSRGLDPLVGGTLKALQQKMLTGR